MPSAAQSLSELLSRKGLAARPRAPGRVSTGIEALDALLGGGYAAGRITQIVGPCTSGRTALALASAAAATAKGGVVALVDAEDALDPRRARGAGVDLARVLWIRPSGWSQALRAAELVLGTAGFSLVVLDPPHRRRAGRGPAASVGGSRGVRQPGAPEAGWPRLARAAEKGGAPLLLLARGELAGPFAFATVALESARAEWRGVAPTEPSARQHTGPAGAGAPKRRHAGPAVLEALHARAALARARDRAPAGPVDLVWRAWE